MRRIWMSLLLLIAIALTACAPATPTEAPEPTSAEEMEETEETTPAEVEEPKESIELLFWAAPNPPQQAFWSDMADMYMEENPHVELEVNSIPESPSSEAGIQAAIAGGTAPVASENIFVGFGGELYRSEALVPLNEMEGWDEVIEARNMEDTIEGWDFGDGNYYILPIYVNAMLFGWRTDIGSEIGYAEPPQTYGEIMEMGEALKEQYPDKFYWARVALTDPTWWERWFDFFILYDAASDGQALITGDEITADDEAAITVLTFLRDLREADLLLTRGAQNPFETGLSVSGQIGPWTFPSWKEQFPDLQYRETFDLAPPPVPDDYPSDQPIKTFADAKGIVFYQQSTEEERMAMWEFLRWVFSDPENDLRWLQDTTLPPARDDLATNDTFQEYFNENPELVPYAENIPNAVPPLRHPQFTEIQRALGDEALVPVLNGEKDPETAWNDWKSTVQPILGQ